MTVGDLWFLAEAADQRAERAYHAFTDRYDEFLTFERTDHVSHGRFRTLARRSRDCGTPYGVHTVVHREDGELLLVRHDGVDLWVLPGGCVEADETHREAARRELAEEAGVEVSTDGLAMVTRLTIRSGSHEMSGVLPVFAARAESHDPEISDPDCEISAARWFDRLPEDTRDREDLLTWRTEAF
ncbi:NUDIX hydrolase [Halomarina oriensis]|uniref:NUDIX domain-containing protein n=1 Tax=Halomarina oriensis TaxID=671145 RepID=A0A6B0GH53_9EURY|nr:NUDIX domain-containing protein [Halomarina oriensis]MWG33910.1 NUDIX domain-containing protein [Halomarina oriensis]